MYGAAAAIVKSCADKAGPVTIRHACETKYPADAASGVYFFAQRRRQTAGKIARRYRTVDQKPTSGRDLRYNPSTQPPGQALRFAVMAFEVFLSYAHETSQSLMRLAPLLRKPVSAAGWPRATSRPGQIMPQR
jgi:hypothetical protein